MKNTMTEEPFFTTLPNRGLIKISGTDRKSFLQGLITNDIHLLEKQNCLYACLLTPQGKFLFDFFITENNETLILDCEGEHRLLELEKLFKMYALRGDLNIQSENNISVYSSPQVLKSSFPDPRHSDMGYRSLIKPNSAEKPFQAWDRHRIERCIPDGSRDMIPGTSTLLECHIDKLNGISFEKGCYVGQELTARMHYRGLAKKHLRVVELLDATTLKIRPVDHMHEACDDARDIEILTIRNSEILSPTGRVVGEMRSSCENIGIGLIKDKM